MADLESGDTDGASFIHQLGVFCNCLANKLVRNRRKGGRFICSSLDRSDAVIDPWLASFWQKVSALYPSLAGVIPMREDEL